MQQSTLPAQLQPGYWSSIPWRDKAARMIAAMAMQSYLAANRLPNGKMRKRHVPYSIPALAEELVDCLKRDDEEGAKALFLIHSVIPELGT